MLIPETITKALPVAIYALCKYMEHKDAERTLPKIDFFGDNLRYASEYEIMAVLKAMPEFSSKSEFELYEIANRLKKIMRF